MTLDVVAIIWSLSSLLIDLILSGSMLLLFCVTMMDLKATGVLVQ